MTTKTTSTKTATKKIASKKAAAKKAEALRVQKDAVIRLTKDFEISRFRGHQAKRAQLLVKHGNGATADQFINAVKSLKLRGKADVYGSSFVLYNMKRGFVKLIAA